MKNNMDFYMKKTITYLFLFSFSVMSVAQPPKLPATKMTHKQEFVDKTTKEKRRFIKTKSTQGSQTWDKKRKKYVKHGIFYTLRSDGTLKILTTWKYGKKSGSYTEYYKKGELKKQGQYLNNQKSGEWKRYKKKGLLSSKYQYKMGKIHGKYIGYFTSKNAKFEQPEFIKNYKNGDKDGKYEMYNIEGEKRIYGSYANGKKHGTWHEYDFNNNLINKKYINGKLIKK